MSMPDWVQVAGGAAYERRDGCRVTFNGRRWNAWICTDQASMSGYTLRKSGGHGLVGSGRKPIRSWAGPTDAIKAVSIERPLDPVDSRARAREGLSTEEN
jgi:hypothetical protein